MLRFGPVCRYLNNFTYSPKGSGLARPMVHVIDWGLARRPNAFNASTGSLNENMALPQRNAPELLLHMGSSYKSDVWRAGFVLTALLTGSRPLVPGKTRWRKSSKERPIDTVLDLTEHFGGAASSPGLPWRPGADQKNIASCCVSLQAACRHLLRRVHPTKHSWQLFSRG